MAIIKNPLTIVQTGGDNKFSQLVDKSITTVTAEDLGDITSIGSYVFYSCSSLTTITIPKTVTNIKSHAFAFCRALKTVDFNTNSSLRTIGNSAFYGCSSLTTITIPEIVTNIESYAFYGCSSLQTVDFGINSSLRTIENQAFYNCTFLTTITIPESVTSIRSSAFSGCSSLQTVIYNGQAPNIQNKCFQNCNSIIKYDFRNCTTVPTLANVDSLGHAAGCEIIIPDALYDSWTTATNWVSLTDVIFVKAGEYTE